MKYRLGEHRVQADPESWIAPNATLVGKVKLEKGASVWFNCVLRGDSDWIIVGDGSNVQDCTVIHTDPGVPVEIGPNVTIGHAAFLHGCKVGENTMIANRAIVLDGARIGSHCIIAAGALVPPGKTIPDGSVIMGSPGQIVRQVTDRDLERIAHACEVYRKRIERYRKELAVDERSR